MFPDKPYAPPVGSFQRPVLPPGVDPDQTPLVYVGFNRQWLDYILGALKQLLLQATWKVSDSSELNLAQQRAFELLYLFSIYIDSAPKLGSAGADAEDIMIRQDPDNPCLLQTSIDGVNWCTFADISKCLPAVGQQGAGAPQPTPGGGTQNYCQELTANAKLLLPTVVNSGDTIHVVSQSGAGNDGGHTTWYCPDGSVFFAGICVPATGGPSMGDPMPSENHMSLIANIDGTYYSLEHGSITVPGGVVNSQITIQVNDDDLTNNSGSYQLCVNVTNNGMVTWCKTIDLRLSTGGWVDCHLPGDGAAIWTPGVGWVGSAGGTAHNFNCEICLTFAASFSLTRLVVISDKTGASGINNTDEAFYNVPAVGTRLYLNSGCAGICTDDSGTVADTASSFTLYHNAGDGGTMTIQSVSIYGTGSIPPELSAWASC